MRSRHGSRRCAIRPRSSSRWSSWRAGSSAGRARSSTSSIPRAAISDWAFDHGLRRLFTDEERAKSRRAGRARVHGGDLDARRRAPGRPGRDRERAEARARELRHAARLARVPSRRGLARDACGRARGGAWPGRGVRARRRAARLLRRLRPRGSRDPRGGRGRRRRRPRRAPGRRARPRARRRDPRRGSSACARTARTACPRSASATSSSRARSGSPRPSRRRAWRRSTGARVRRTRALTRP